ncbi:hypothetical protein A2U01_0013440 [Trifolium medium]|uniref:Uncharacterized protein n=1 Tax=Trifolium medium TaxID=97028 RepID=A0A392MYA5_9FABA|nr:hypothetical protein [Trifolium medium]
MEDVWFDTYKLRANLAKFQRDEAHDRKTHQPNRGETGKRSITEIKQGLTFKEAVTGGLETLQKNNSSVVGDKIIDQGGWKFKQKGQMDRRINQQQQGYMEIEVEKDNITRLEKSWIGELWDYNDAKNIQIKIWMEGFQNITAKWLGMKMVLLSSMVDGEVQRVIEANKEWWSRIFVEVKPWTPLSRPHGRIVWVRIYGVPLQVWGEECFKRFVWGFGELIKLDVETAKQNRLDVARVLIKVNSWESVDELVEFKVNRDIFVTRVEEEKLGAEEWNKPWDACSKYVVARTSSTGLIEKEWLDDEILSVDGKQDGGSDASQPQL